MISDPLITEYAQTRSSETFARLVTQYVDLVYSSARRQVNDSHHAEDVTQAVFILLAQKASEIPADRPIAGWLLNTTRYVALNLRRELSTRKSHEQKAATMQPESTDQPSNKEWNDIAPLLDEGLAKLSGSDRDALLLRFTENKSLRETGQSLGISEAAAEKRVSRAIEKLRAFFAGKGIAVSNSAVTVGLTSQLITQAPHTLLSHITGTSSVSSLVTKLALTKTKVGLMTAMNLKIAACITFGLIATGTTVAIVQQMQVQPAKIVQAPQPAREATKDELYHLNPDEPMRIVKDAPVAARQEIWDQIQTVRAAQGQPKQPLPPGPFVFDWSDGKPGYAMVYGQNTQIPLSTLISTSITIASAMKTYNIEINDNFPKTLWEIPGDIVYTNKLPIDKTLAGLQKIIRDETGLTVSLSLQYVPRKVFVVKGKFSYNQLQSNDPKTTPAVKKHPIVIELFGSDNIDNEKIIGTVSWDMGPTGGPFSGQLAMGNISSWVGEKEIIDESTGWPGTLMIREHLPQNSTVESTKNAHDPDRVLKNICQQTGLSYTEETRVVPRVIVTLEEKK